MDALLENLSGYESVQFAAVFGIGIWGIVFMFFRSTRQSELLKSEDQRQKDAIPIERRIGDKKKDVYQEDM